MSRILKYKKGILNAVIGILAIIFLINNIYILFYLSLIGLMFLWIDNKCYRCLIRQKEPFTVFSNIRNVKYLFIGDVCNVEDYIPDGNAYVQIESYNRSLYSSFEILKHTTSILDEDEGHVFFLVEEKKRDSHLLSIFDIPFLSTIFIEEKNLQKLVKHSRHPLFFAPIQAIILLFGIKKSGWYECKCTDIDIRNFCKDRNIDIVILSR